MVLIRRRTVKVAGPRTQEPILVQRDIPALQLTTGTKVSSNLPGASLFGSVPGTKKRNCQRTGLHVEGLDGPSDDWSSPCLPTRKSIATM
jgi:hypothetical protein